MNRIKFIFLSLMIYLTGALAPQAHADDNRCIFPDIPSFVDSPKLSGFNAYRLSFYSYRFFSPEKGRELFDCARALYKNADKTPFDKKAVTRLARSMTLSWQSHDAMAAATVDGYIALGACADGPCNAYMGTMILNPARKLVAIGLTLNDTDQIDDNAYADYFHTNFVFIRDTGEKSLADGKILNLILAGINKNYSGFYLFDKIYIIDSHLN